jgi:hypothetical protein
MRARSTSSAAAISASSNASSRHASRATNWTVEGRAKWLQAAANIFDLIYQGSGEIDIRAKSGDASKE